MDSFEAFVRLAAAMVAGGLIGANRSTHGKPAGVRLHALVAIGSALLALTFAGNADSAGRVVQGIVGGIGFLGAGVIMRAAGNTRAHQIFHLTTAATIWVTAAIGVACALVGWPLIFAAEALILFTLVVGIRIDRAIFAKLGNEEEGGDPID